MIKNKKIKLLFLCSSVISVFSIAGYGVNHILKNNKSDNSKNTLTYKKSKDIKKQKDHFKNNKENIDNGFFPEIDFIARDQMYQRNVYIDKNGNAKIHKNIVFDVLKYINEPKNLSFFSGTIVYDYKISNNNQKIIVYLGWMYKNELKNYTSYTFELEIKTHKK